VKDEYPTLEALVRNPDIMQQAMEAYVRHKAGPLVAAPTATGFASLEKVQSEFPDAENHIQALVAEYSKKHPHADPAGRDALLSRQLMDPKEAICQIVALPLGANLAKAEIPSKIFPSEEPGMWVTIGACSTRSFSRGSVHINSSNPTAHPSIDPAYFKHPLDVDMMARALLHVLSFTEIEPMKSILRRVDNGEVVVAESSGGKAPRTLAEAKGGVVSDELRVYGTANVRVVDASIFPTHVQGNIVSLVYAIAEKAADIIKGKPVEKLNGTNGTNGVNGH
jgi:choline dehydrogenase